MYANRYAKQATIAEMLKKPQEYAPTVSAHFLRAMLTPLRSLRSDAVALRILNEAKVPAELLEQPGARISRDQFVLLYKRIAFELDDEMFGLWSRPIRGGTLKYLCLSLLDAPTVLVALNRFVRFWNLILDDYKLQMSRQDGLVCIALQPRRPETPITMLGHELMMKLVHGIVSWLLAKEIPLERVEFAFPRPAHANDYVFLYPGEVHYGADESAVWLADAWCRLPFKREKHQLWAFLKRAPEDWVFTMFHHSAISVRTREYLEARLGRPVELAEVANAFHLSSRTLTRKLTEEGTSFQSVKDDLRRDVAIERLGKSKTSVSVIAADLGYANAAAFCRAFRQWTGSTPTAYRRGEYRAR